MAPRAALALAALSLAASAPTSTPGAGVPGARPAQAVVDSLIEAERYADAIAAARGALPAVDDPAAAVELRSSLMLALFHAGELAAARAEQESVVALRATLLPATDPQRADDLNDLAMICDRLGDDAAAADAWRKSLDLLRALPAEDVAERFVPRLSALAEAERRLGRYEECERALREAIATSEARLPRDQRHARLLNNLGALAWDEQRFDEASRLLREALRVTEEDSTAAPSRVAIAHHNLANLKREQGEWEESEELHRRALAIARAHLTADPQFPIFLKELAVLYADEERFDEAFALWDEALAALGARRGELLASEILYERARADLSRGRLDAAEKSLRECLAIRRAKRSSGHPMIGQALAGLGALEAKRGRRREARSDLERAVAILERTAVYPEERAEALEGLARLAWRDGRREDAVAAMRRSLEGLEELRLHRAASELSRADWARRAEEPTRTMVEWLARLGRVDQAIGVAERIRGRILSDQIAAAHVDWRRDLPAERRVLLAARERDALARIGSVRRELEDVLARDDARADEAGERLEAAVRAYRDVLEEGRAQSRSWARALGEATATPVVDALRARLAPGDVVLSYEIGADASFLFEIAPDAPARCTELRMPAGIARAWGCEAGPLSEATLAAVLRAGHGPAPAVDGAAARAELRGVGTARPAAETSGGGIPAPTARERDLERLADVLLPEPARARVLAATRVHVVPDGPLHDVPFEALALRGADGALRYWLEGGPPVCYGSSLATIVELASRERSLPPGSLVLTVNDPERGGTSESSRRTAPSTLAELAHTGRFHPLPGTRREGEACVRAFASREVVRLAGADAREGEVKRLAPRARILHLGTHGVVERERSDLLAALVLADEPSGSGEDGFLHLFEVYELPLAAELVVLSACETMQGTPVRGEGVLALSRGFLAAGARRVVASLWPVDDDATAELMGVFFAELARTNDAAAALRTAKRTLRARADRADPFFWAPFVLSGSF
jgi:tetratricopeptide (TPR) repeat protein